MLRMTEHANEKTMLTKNERLILDSLSQAETPQSAYDLLDSVRDQGIRAPAQVYRALSGLMSKHLIHRIDSSNTYLCCQKPSHEHPNAICLAICDECQQVTELDGVRIGDQLEEYAKASGFESKLTSVELRGLCAKCH